MSDEKKFQKNLANCLESGINGCASLAMLLVFAGLILFSCNPDSKISESNSAPSVFEEVNIEIEWENIYLHFYLNDLWINYINENHKIFVHIEGCNLDRELKVEKMHWIEFESREDDWIIASYRKFLTDSLILIRIPEYLFLAMSESMAQDAPDVFTQKEIAKFLLRKNIYGRELSASSFSYYVVSVMSQSRCKLPEGGTVQERGVAPNGAKLYQLIKKPNNEKIGEECPCGTLFFR